jgi:hypothetical protein
VELFLLLPQQFPRVISILPPVNNVIKPPPRKRTAAGRVTERQHATPIKFPHVERSGAEFLDGAMWR